MKISKKSSTALNAEWFIIDSQKFIDAAECFDLYRKRIPHLNILHSLLSFPSFAYSFDSFRCVRHAAAPSSHLKKPQNPLYNASINTQRNYFYKVSSRLASLYLELLMQCVKTLPFAIFKK